jgi:hypothetical protein
MIFQKNLPGWERTMRVVLGAIMIGYGLVGLPAVPLGYAIAAGGAIAIITGFFGFCPMCDHGRPQAAVALTLLVQQAVKRCFRGIFVNGAGCRAAAANWESAWPRFREMTLKTLHDDHTGRFASRTRRSQQQSVPAMERSGKGERCCRSLGHSSPTKNWEK